MLGRTRWTTILAVASLTVAVWGGTAIADSSSEGGFLAKINAERAAQGLNALEMNSDLRAYARTHSQFMADGKCPDGANICHSSDLGSAPVSGWSKLGENVGRGGSVDSLHKAFMDSSGHRKNILDPAWTQVGIGTLYANDRLYVTVVFMAKGKASVPKAGTKPATAETKPTTTTTTLPPTTTTTLVVGPDKPVTPGEACVSVSRLWWMCHD